jgi:hypothetical protein
MENGSPEVGILEACCGGSRTQAEHEEKDNELHVITLLIAKKENYSA